VNFEQGIKLFDKLSAPEKYMPTWLKIFLCSKTLSRLRSDSSQLLAKSQRNKNCMSQIQNILKIIIENSCFDDLIVWAKLSLVNCISMGWLTVEKRLNIFNLCNSCIEENYGYLPKIFKYIVTSVFRQPSEWEPQNGAQEKFLMLQNLYFKTKKMIKNKTFQNLRGEKTYFLEGSLLFFRISKAFERHAHLNIINIKKETEFLHEVLDFWTPNLISDYGRYNYLGEILFLNENYEEALKNFELFQEIVSAKFGNTQAVGTAYQNQVECHIKLGQKSMAKKILKTFKRFHFDSNIGPLIDHLEEQIKAMPNETNVTCYSSKQKNQNVRAPTKCSSYKCMKIEPYVGAFKHCARCRMTYYCSKKMSKTSLEIFS